MTPMFTHRYVLEELPNFNILPGHVVHHRDKNKLNNRLANLDVMTKDAHDDIHLKGAPNRLFRKKQT